MALLACLASAGPAWAHPGKSILILGDSLSAEYGLARGTGWVTHLAPHLQSGPNPPVELVNASVSGETSSGGKARIDQLLRVHHPNVLVLELGANDGLRGLPTQLMRENLRTIIRHAQAQGVKVVLVGMRLPPNFGEAYAEGFHRAFVDLAQQEKPAGFVPFLLAGFAEQDDMFQADHLHPLAQAQGRMAETVWKALGPALGQR